MIKSLDAANVYVHKRNDANWVRYSNDALDVTALQLISTKEAIYLYDDCQGAGSLPTCLTKYIELNGNVDAVLLTSPSNLPTAIPINAAWDIVFALSKKLLSDDDVWFFRRTACTWVQKKNANIVATYSLLQVHFYNKSAVIVLQSMSDPNELVTISPYTLTRSNSAGAYATVHGKWFNDKYPLSYYFTGLFQCNAKSVKVGYKKLK